MPTLPDVPQTALGTQGLVVSVQGIGAVSYGPPPPDEDKIKHLRYAVESGITFIDTSDVYGPHTNEILVGKAIKGLRDKVQLATKFGVRFDEERNIHIRGDPAYVRDCLEGSLRRLDVDYIDLYYQHRIDPNVPIEITVGVLKEFVEAGKVKYIGLSDPSMTELRRAHAVHPITAIQIEYSLWDREANKELIPTCRELGIGIVAYSPLGRGFFSGLKAAEMADDDYRKTLPRFQLHNMERNKTFYERLVIIAERKNVTPGQLALAWVQQHGNDVVPIPGSSKRKNLDENIQAVAIHISKDESKELEDAVPTDEICGARVAEGCKKYSWQFVTTPPLAAWNHETQTLHPDWSTLDV